MEPAILAGERIVVWKPWMGARLFNLFSLFGEEQPQIYRLPATCNLKRNDIAVFNYPYYNGWDKIEMYINKYYVKRCIALPGDTLSIIGGWYRIAGFNELVGNRSAQLKLANQPDSLLDQRKNWSTYPNNSLFNWNIKNFGPLMIPAKGITIKMSKRTYILYQALIEWESKKTLFFNDLENRCYLHGYPLLTYQFCHNYFPFKIQAKAGLLLLINFIIYLCARVLRGNRLCWGATYQQ